TVFGQQLDGGEQDPAVDPGGEAGLLGDLKELAGRYLHTLRVDQAQQHLVVLLTVAAQADDRLEQQAETVLLQRLLQHGQHVATAGRGGQFVGRVVDVQPVTVGDVFGATVGAVD